MISGCAEDSTEEVRVLLGVKQVARELSVSPGTVRGLIAAGRLASVRLGRRLLVRRATLERFLEELEGELVRGKGSDEAERASAGGRGARDRGAR